MRRDRPIPMQGEEANRIGSLFAIWRFRFQLQNESITTQDTASTMPASPLPPAADWPPHDDLIVAAVAQAMQDGSWGRYEGCWGAELQSAMRERWERSHVELCCSGTVATELALRGIPVDGGEVIMAAYDFPGNFRAIEMVGATPVLVDVSPNRYTLDPEQLPHAMSSSTRAVIVSHLHGDLAPMSRILQWARREGVPVIEDVCQSPGAIVDGRQAGCWGDAATFSFGGSKLLTAGRGGAIATDDAAVAQRIKIYTERGNHSFPLSELQAAALLPQLRQLDHRNQIRADGMHVLQSRLADANAPSVDLDPLHGAAFRFPVRVRDRDAFVHTLTRCGAPVGAGFRGFLKRRRRCRRVGDLCHAQEAAEQTALIHHAALLSSKQYLHALAFAIASAAQE